MKEVTPVFSVSEFLDFVNELFKAREFFVVGEVTGAKPHPTGFYFSLKDKDGSLMDCYMSPYAYRGLGLPVEDGMEVKVGGSPSIYKAKGRFSFRVETLELAGEGSLKKAYELLKKQLQAEGLFDRKRTLGEFPEQIGIITSRTGAVIDDFRKNLAKAGLKLYLKDTRVEGAQAVDGLLKAIKYFNEEMPGLDALVIIRGGGSLEDLQAFNNELVARAIFGSKIPTICAIGHDRDTPISSLVADYGAHISTPTAAANLLSESWKKLKAELPYRQNQILSFGVENIRSTKDRARVAANQVFASFKELLKIPEYWRERTTGFLNILKEQIAGFSTKIHDREKLITSQDPKRNLKLGYSILRAENGQLIRSKKEAPKGTKFKAETGDGGFLATAD